MDGSTVVALAVSMVALVAFAVAALMFWQGKWLFLLLGKSAHVEGVDGPGQRRLARRMAAVLLICCVLVATLVLFEMAKLAGSTTLASVLALVNNGAFLALIVGLIWFFIVQRPIRGKDDVAESGSSARRAHAANLDHLHAATILFVIALLAIVALVGILNAGI